MFFAIPSEWADGNRLILIGAIFPLVGMGLAAYAVYAFLQWRKFGNTELELFSNPGVLGGYLEGRIHTNIRARGSGPFRLTLSCIRTETSGSGKNRSSTDKTLWQDTAEVPANALLAGPHGASVPVRFAIPYEAGPQSDPDASAPIKWRLDVAAELPGVDYSTNFTVPVFRTVDSDPELEVETEAPPLSVDARSPEALQSLGIHRQSTPAGGVAYVFRRARARGAAIGLTLFTIIWCGFIWIMRAVGAPIFFPIVFGLFALLLLAGLIDLWLKQTRIEVANGRLAFNRRFLGRGKTRIFEGDDIRSIKSERGMQSGNKLFYRLRLHTRDGKTHTLASLIRDQRLAKRIVDDLEEALREGDGGGSFSSVAESGA
jgi:hypothetical protein